MKTTAILTAAVLATLGACASSNRDMSNSSASDSSYGDTSSSATGRTPSGSMSNQSSSQSSNSTASNTSSQNWSGVVVTIDPILRQDAAAMGVGVTGAAAAGGTMLNDGSPTDKVYRVTMRADDGSTQTVVLDSMPTYKAGDRIRYRNGSVQRE